MSGAAAEEHIFRRWLLKHLGIPKTEQVFQETGDTATLDLGDATDAYTIGLQIQDLILLVAFAQRSGVEFVTGAGVHVPLNPPGVIWPCYLAPAPQPPQPSL